MMRGLCLSESLKERPRLKEGIVTKVWPVNEKSRNRYWVHLSGLKFLFVPIMANVCLSNLRSISELVVIILLGHLLLEQLSDLDFHWWRPECRISICRVVNRESQSADPSSCNWGGKHIINQYQSENSSEIQILNHFSLSSALRASLAGSCKFFRHFTFCAIPKAYIEMGFFLASEA